MTRRRMILRKACLYGCTLLSSAFAWWVGTALMNEMTGALGLILRVFAVALPVLLLVQELHQYARSSRARKTPSLSQNCSGSVFPLAGEANSPQRRP
jgi:hypothetical protein